MVTMSDTAEPGPPIDTSKASIARVYDAFLGGKDHYEVDREVYRRVQQLDPGGSLAKLARAWLIRAVRFLAADEGIDQFLDCGCGLPTMENTHEVAQRANPEAVVVYVDNDPIVAAHGRALLEDNDNSHFAVCDLRYSHEVLNHPVVTRYLELDRPLALIQCATLHHVEDSEGPREIMARYIDALPSGSYVVLSHFYDAADGSRFSRVAREMQQRFRESSMATGRFRTREEIASYFEGLELLEPGLVKLFDWWPDGPRLAPIRDPEHCILGAVGSKP
jgi:hypothetical protein